MKEEQKYLKNKYKCQCENFPTCGMYLNPNENWLYCNSCLDSHDFHIQTKENFGCLWDGHGGS
jgi:hypothetical protein